MLGQEYVVFGKPALFGTKMNIAHPDVEPVAKASALGTVKWDPVYSTTEKLTAKGLNSKGIGKLIKTILPQIRGKVPEVLSDQICREFHLMPREQALYALHLPKDQDELKRAQVRIKFEELFLRADGPAAHQGD